MPYEKIQMLHPEADKEAPRIDRWKYEAVRGAILEGLARCPSGRPLSELPRMVRSTLCAQELRDLGSIEWYATVVKLDLEARGVIERVPGSQPQSLRLKG